MAQSTAERTASQRTLVCLLQGLTGQRTTVELRDRSAVYGHITGVDALMNITFKTATMYSANPKELPKRFDDFHLVGKLVRYVHIPPGVDGIKTIEKQIAAMQGKKPSRRYNAGNLDKRKAQNEEAIKRFRDTLQKHKSEKAKSDRK